MANGYPDDEVCLVFRWDEDHMGHVGVYQADGKTIIRDSIGAFPDMTPPEPEPEPEEEPEEP